MPLLSMETNRCHFRVGWGMYLCYSQIKIWREGNMTNDKRTSFSKTEGESNYTGMETQITVYKGGKIGCGFSLVPDPGTPAALRQPLQHCPCRRLWRRPEAEGRGASVGRVAAAPQSPKTWITFTNTYINTLHTTASLGGRLPHRGSADTVTCLRNSRKGRRAPREMSSMCFLLPRGSPPSPPRFRVQFVQYGELP